MELTHEDIARIVSLVDQSGYDEVSLEYGGLKLHFSRQATGDALQPVATTPGAEKAPASTPAQPSPLPAPRPAPARETQSVPEGLVAVKAPMVGIFYRAPSPGAPPFVDEGSPVAPDTAVGLIEVMKLFNTLTSGVDGHVERFLVDNASPVEFGQPLLLIRPAGNVETSETRAAA